VERKKGDFRDNCTQARTHTNTHRILHFIIIPKEEKNQDMQVEKRLLACPRKKLRKKI